MAIHTVCLLSRLELTAANAVSGPMSWGFPAPTAFTGFAHALQLQLKDWIRAGVAGVGIVCHRFDPQISQPSGSRTFVFCLNRHPVGKDGKPPSIVEEGKANLEISLVIALKDDIDPDDKDDFLDALMSTVARMRIAGGSIRLPENSWRNRPELLHWADDLKTRKEQFRTLSRKMLPGFALVLRNDRMQQTLETLRQQDDSATALDAVLEHGRMRFSPEREVDQNDELKDKVQWHIQRKQGWTVPLPVGYAAISELYEPGVVRNVRDTTVPFRFVESLYSIGEWLGPHRIDRLEQMLWTHQHDAEKGLYLCQNDYVRYLAAESTESTFSE
tara:strand:- start:1361 stop:2350 length:990 start_codon:yes stop_codon:yes gene_type:complete